MVVTISRFYVQLSEIVMLCRQMIALNVSPSDPNILILNSSFFCYIEPHVFFFIQKLTELGVERLVLPAVPGVLKTWTTSFGFSVVEKSERANFLDYTFLDFQDTVMCQKILKKTPAKPQQTHVENTKSKDNVELDDHVAVFRGVSSNTS